jgi:hypothetical protein
MNKEVVEQQQVQELLLPRYKVIADFPGNWNAVGTIIEFGSSAPLKVYCDGGGHEVDKYPHIFRKLEWWEERTEEERPPYVKHIQTGQVFKTHQSRMGYGFIKINERNSRDHLPSRQLLPATEAEFLNQQNLNNG